MITDANGCTSSATTTVTVYAEPTATASNSGPVCYDAVSLSLMETGGDAVSWAWSSDAAAVFSDASAQNPTVSGFVDGEEFTVMITDANGCTSSATTNVTVYAELTCIAVMDSPVNCDGEFTGIATVTPSGGTAPYTYEWDNGETTATATALNLGDHSVIVTDANGCTTECQVFVDAIPCQSLGGFCFFTQGFYGNMGGKGWTSECDQLTALEMMQLVLPGGGSEIFGVLANNLYFTLYGTDISNYSIFNMLPGGGKAKSLTGVATFSNVASWPFVPMENNSKKKTFGKINNILLAQAITFYFNLGNNDGSESFVIEGNRLVTAPADCSFENVSIERDTFNIPQNVIDYLGINNTLGGLLQLAKDVLGGDYNPAMISPSEVAGALDAFNRGFDECRAFIEFFTEPENGAQLKFSGNDLMNPENSLNLEAYPNPFSRYLRFEFQSNTDSHVTLELYDIRGSKVRTLYSQTAVKDQKYYVEIDGSGLLNGTYFYRLTSNDEVKHGRVIKFLGY